MFGLDFLFAWGLLALPLAGLPILLHLIFRRKSPVIQFSTLRFIKSSIQRTQARRRVQRWLLLACRVLLLALLIWAISQPSRKLAAWFTGESTAAAIVVDTTYSMELQDHQASLLTKANDAIDRLLRDDLSGAHVAIFTSQPSPTPEKFETVATIQSNWRPLQAQPAAKPLEDRVAAAEAALQLQGVDHKWLIILTDLQRHEFPDPLPDFPDGKVVLIDLHPDDVRAAAIASVAPEPVQPRLGISGQIAVQVNGRDQDSHALNLTVATVGNPQTPVATPSLPMARIDATGQSVVRVPFTFASDSWLLLTASLQSPGDLPWANSRSQLLHIPPQATAAVMMLPRANPQADAIVRLALDPGQGSRPAWPIRVRPAGPLNGDEQIVAVNLTQWQDAAVASQLAAFVRRGGTLVLFLQPGLEASWQDLSDAQKNAWADLLPGTPVSPAPDGPFIGSIARPDDALLSDVGKTESASGNLRIDRMVPLDITDSTVQTILSAAPSDPKLGSTRRGLLLRRPLGAGQAFIWTTLPTPQYGNLMTYELFLPMLVNCSIRPESEAQAANVEIGSRITLPSQSIAGGAAGPLQLVPPAGPPFEVNLTTDSQGQRYVSDPVTDPGLYTWKRGDETVAYTNVQYPAAETRLTYRRPDELAAAGPDVILAHSMDDLQDQMKKLTEPEPHWSTPIAVVMLLLCVEALMGSLSNVWKQQKKPGEVLREVVGVGAGGVGVS